MKMRIEKMLVMSLLSLAMFSCSKDDGVIDLPITPPTPDPEQPVDPPAEDVLFGINPVIAGIVPVTRGIITNFTDNDRIGLFLTDGELGLNYQENAEAANVPAMYQQGSWKVEKDLVLSEEGTAFAYYPYNSKVTDGTVVPLEIESQTDYLYATPAVVDEKNPIAQIGMKHALSLISVRIRKNDYQHAGKLTKVEVLDVQQNGTMNIATGVVTKTGPTAIYSVNRDLVLDDNDLAKTQMIMLPTVIAEAGNIRFQITVDDKYYIWEVPKSHIWEAGKEYTYTLNLSKTPEELPDLELDVDYWTQYGKDDNIQIEDHTQPGSAYYRVVDVEMGRTSYGRTVVQGESYIFTGVVNDRKDGFKGRVKYSLWQGDKMVEQFPSYYFECKYFMTLCIPCYITAAPGTYRLKMLLKEEGSNTWILPSDRYSEECDWMFTVKADNNLPSLRSINLEGFTASNNTIQSVKLNQPFNMEFALTNRAAVPLKGEIKAVWHRSFTGEFDLISNNDGNAWEDEIGRMPINILSSTKEYKDKLPCRITLNRTYSNKCCPRISLYYKAEDSNTWSLMRSDSDSELQRWKGVDADKIIMGSNDEPEKSWFCKGGLNYQYVELE